MILYHFTCVDHGLRGIQRSGLLKPHSQPLLQASLVWLTDLEVADRFALGLTSQLLSCDRTAARVTVNAEAGAVEPWGAWAHRNKVARVLRDTLEDGAWPAHWFVSEQELPVGAVRCAVR